ncbi:hypothetical protein T8K17_21520 [Thalassobaculum sp. OXR-137]|uniref:RSP_7527 family protein n=1 Tax=Thalassobaculum sp. OXR-137 TaxID=3100173 RepID=UPI002AC9B2D0|nr:hypothetical protein [Thalassobaculum sp. OXR-137]WPZ33806.1 hypothetical protein T8K17_21520 [Thalassobaculum sp. OXR-137]
MTSIDTRHAHLGAIATGTTDTADGARWTTATLSPKAIDQAVLHGRRLRAQAFAKAASGIGAWVVATVRSALGRRATNKLGCGECGDMMRA